jgi:hypothetical protein
MKITGQKHIDHADLAAGHFNNCQHTFLECEFGIWQTISVKLPNGKHVTFAFCPSSTPGEVECVDIHTMGHDTFATRDLKESTGFVLSSFLLKSHANQCRTFLA